VPARHPAPRGSTEEDTTVKPTTIAMLPLLAALSACATSPTTEADRRDLKSDAAEALKELKAQDPGLGRFLDGAHGYVVFPRIGKGGYIFGGGYGRGIVYRHGASIGYADITEATFGLQIGGQAFMQVLVLESARDLERFTAGSFSVTANVSAVILKTGAAATTQYTDGVAVFVKPIGGAMVEASVGGQQFS
jgi:lipid-binding SYLF domain-containing protein